MRGEIHINKYIEEPTNTDNNEEEEGEESDKKEREAKIKGLRRSICAASERDEGNLKGRTVCFLFFGNLTAVTLLGPSAKLLSIPGQKYLDLI